MRRAMRTTLMLAAAAVVSTAALGEPKQTKTSAPSVGGAEPKLLGQYADWGAFTASPEGGKVCFALGKPKSSETKPANRKRDQAYIFIATRPAEKVRNEISVIMGYQFKSDADATAEIGTTRFAMYTQRDGAWIKNITEEVRLIDAMRKGAELTIKGTSNRNTQTSDVYSLKGLSQAMDRVDQECK
jgi:invasion protein IalB